jgi:geranylgeranylglycerol-phosphate geranylgeranyltransferase
MSARRLAGLVHEGLSCFGQLVTGRTRSWPEPLGYGRVLGGALRPHFFGLPAGAALAGGAAIGSTEARRVAVAATLAGLGWGVGQLLNDLLDCEADTIDAPDRPAVRGSLPEGPTMLIAMLLGLGIAVGTTLLHPAALWLALLAAVLLLGYGSAKRWPLAGNLAHGALVATSTLIGAVAGAPGFPVEQVIPRVAPMAALVCGWAMVYLESNYEKDRRGDRAAGYVTLPHVLGLRLSAALRAAGAVALASVAYRRGFLPGQVAPFIMGLGACLVLVSSGSVLRAGTERAALGGYRASVHAAALGMFALGCPLTGDLGTLCLVGLNAILVERAFRRSPNP